MKLQWLGTAGFKVEVGDRVFLIDPYLSRNAQARPVQSMQPAEIAGAGQIFITHGHFDHLHDVPAIMASGSSTVYCSETAAATLMREGVDGSRITTVGSDGFAANFGAYRAEAFFSRHVKFDIPLVARTLWRIGPRYRRLSGMHRGYPVGQVLSWRFTIGGYTMHHFGSGGSPPEELERLAAHPPDLLLVPLQGHSHICDIAFEYVRVLRPRMVIPHHQDDFYPPISTAVDVSPFVKKVRENFPGTEVKIMAINETITL
ncbi:MAG: MBL fold metallo-hydrolase [Chloroflexi bacterium]|nr:MBL fold metallo-hydrolase [Chloroflexota bacterium]